MNLDVNEVTQLPPLGWVLRVDGADANAWHGSHVARGENWLFDGIWAGDFAAGDFMGSERFGCGVRCSRDGIELATPSAPIDRIVVGRSDHIIWASNSLPLLLGVLDDELDPDELDYRSQLVSREIGQRLRPLTWRTRTGRELRFLIHETALIRHDGNIRTEPLPLSDPYPDYRAYVGHLRSTIAAARANAKDPLRPRRFPLVPLLSTGYDSTAATVLCRAAGVTEAITLRRYDEATGDLVDHPAKSAEALGIDLIELERGGWRDRSDLVEATLAAAGATMMDVAFLDLEATARGRTLVTGYSGDNVWGVDNPRVHADFVTASGTYSGRGLAEWRLRVPFAILAAPSIGQSAHPSIHDVTTSAEMKPWWVDGTYNRPIPRRLAEEAGIARGDFATRKWAGSARVGNRQTRFMATTSDEARSEVSDFLSPDAADSFIRFVEEHGGPERHVSSVRTLLHRFYVKLDSLDWRVGLRGRRIRIKGLIPRRARIALASRYRIHHDYTGLLPHWGTKQLKQAEADVIASIRSLSSDGQPAT